MTCHMGSLVQLTFRKRQPCRVKVIQEVQSNVHTSCLVTGEGRKKSRPSGAKSLPQASIRNAGKKSLHLEIKNTLETPVYTAQWSISRIPNLS